MRIWLWAACVLNANCGFHSLWSSVGKRTTEPAGCVRIKWFSLLWKSPLFFKDYHKNGCSPIKWKGKSSLPLGGTLSQILTPFLWNLNSLLSFLHAWILASLFGATQSHLAETCMELAVGAFPHMGTAMCWLSIRQLLSAYQQKELWMSDRETLVEEQIMPLHSCYPICPVILYEEEIGYRTNCLKNRETSQMFTFEPWIKFWFMGFFLL